MLNNIKGAKTPPVKLFSLNSESIKQQREGDILFSFFSISVDLVTLLVLIAAAEV